MRVRKDEWITTIVFCAFLGIMSLLMLLLPKSSFSKVEKRNLEKAPKLTTETLTSGKFGEKVETYMADHIPGRNFFVGLNAYVDLYTGRQVSKDIYLVNDNRLVEAPVAWNEAQVRKNVDAIKTLSEKLDRQVELMIVPSAGWAAEQSLVGLADPYMDDKIIEDIYTVATDADISCMDIRSVFKNRKDLYYKTDHHWTSEGAYLAYAAYMDSKGREYPKAEEFTVETAYGFHGTTYSRSALWLTPSEPLEMWTCSENLQVTNRDDDQLHQGVFYPERLQEEDKYTVFLDGNHGVVTIHNPDNAGKGSVLVIRDSYSNCLGPFLAQSYENVVLLDMRWTNDSVLELCQEQEYDDILVCYSIGNFMTDQNFFKMKF